MRGAETRELRAGGPRPRAGSDRGAAYQRAEPEHKTFRGKAEEFYRLYRGFTDFRDQRRDARDRDRWSPTRAEWGAELFIPFCFSTVETIIPRMVAKGPRMIVVPRDEQALGNVHNMKIVVDAQCKQIDYETVLQVIGKDGLIYGLGVGKTRWKYETRMQVKATPHPLDPAASSKARRRRPSPSMTRSPSASTRSTSCGTRSATR
jgi:hypothetical protein